ELAREQSRRLRRDAVPRVRGSERVSRELEEDPPIDRASPLRLLSHRSRLSVELLAKLVPDEPPDGNLLPDLGGDLVDDRPNRLRVVLDELLVEQHVVAVEGLELALHHP